MPIIRYFLFAGAFAVALLFVLDRNLPPVSNIAASPQVDRTVIRVRSARILPEKVIFDTSTQIAATVSLPLLAAEQAERSFQDALAMGGRVRPRPNVTPMPRRGARAAIGFRSKRAAASSPRLDEDEQQATTGAF